MNDRIIKTSFHKVSSIRPTTLKKLIMTEVNEKSKDKIYNYLKDLGESYPNFDEWYYKVVFKDVEEANGKREIILAISELDSKKSVITGIAILKSTEQEKKICTFRVHESYRSNGIGSDLFEHCFQHLGTKLPIITISENRLSMFQNHIEKYNFKLYQTLDNYYTHGSTEYVYNGTL